VTDKLKIYEDILAFHNAAEVPSRDTPGFPDDDRVALRRSLIEEEVGETLAALEARDIVEVADGIADSIVVLVGTALELGIDLTAVWNEVHRSNMAKFPECIHCRGTGTIALSEEVYTNCMKCDGRGTLIIRREDGKILKPDGWVPPNIPQALGVKND
jgi:predicted HAD superfamily Cof-like phosphohydrolase